MKNRFIIPVFLFFLLGQIMTGQENARRYKYIQLTGTITDVSGKPLPYVHVINLNKGNATFTDESGIFSLVVKREHSIMITSIGYVADTLSIPDTLDDYVYYIQKKLRPDTIMLETVTIFPWATYAEFREAFRELNLTNNETNYAEQNMEHIMRQINKQLSYVPDPGGSYDMAMQEHLNANMTKGTLPTLSLLNPIAWAQFFEAIKNGMFSSKKEE